MGNDVMISVDPHKASNTAAVMDPVTRTVIACQRFANTLAGYQQLRGFVEKWRERRWAVEGCHGAGRLLAQRLVADGESVLDVPAKLAARVRVYSQGHGRKTDVDDAVCIGLAALHSAGVAAVRADDVLVSPAAALRPQRRARRVTHAGGMPVPPAAHRAHPRRDAPRIARQQSRATAGQTAPERPGGQRAVAAGMSTPRRHPRPRHKDEDRPRTDRAVG
jgi:hypothetical protein